MNERGEAALEKHGKDHFTAMGRKGGKVLRERGHEYFVEIARLSALKRRQREEP